MKRFFGWWRGHLWLANILLLIFAYVILPSLMDLVSPHDISLSKLRQEIATHHVESADFDQKNHVVTVELNDKKTYRCGYPAGYEGSLTTQLVASKAKVTSATPDFFERNMWLLIIGGCTVVIIIVASVGLPRAIKNSVGGSDDKKLQSEIPKTRFSDVIGIDHILPELQQLVDIIQRPQHYLQEGLTTPKGAVLFGPPGTGKTHLARAIAGEAGVPLCATSGASFITKWQGSGPEAVRELFSSVRSAARKNNSAGIVFIDEFDAVGGSRRDARHGADDERNSTVGALLTEMDGFSQSEPTYVIVATNREKALDSALMRAGRIEMRVDVPLPDRKSRKDILKYYAAKLGNFVSPDVDYDAVADMTPGLSGATLKRLVNEAGLLAKRLGDTQVLLKHFKDALSSAMIGAERKNLEVTEEDRRIKAAHEAGHALVAIHANSPQKPHRVSIVPRGGAGGVTWMTGGNRELLPRDLELARLAHMMGGRAGEMLLLDGEFTAGAADDLVHATELARNMVFSWGMDDYLIQLDEDGDNIADAELKADALMKNALRHASTVLAEHSPQFDELVELLLEHETVEGELLERFMPQAAA